MIRIEWKTKQKSCCTITNTTISSRDFTRVFLLRAECLLLNAGTYQNNPPLEELSSSFDFVPIDYYTNHKYQKN